MATFPFNYTEMPINESAGMIYVCNPYDQVIITLLIFIAFCQGILLFKTLQSWVTKEEDD